MSNQIHIQTLDTEHNTIFLNQVMNSQPVKGNKKTTPLLIRNKLNIFMNFQLTLLKGSQNVLSYLQ